MKINILLLGMSGNVTQGINSVIKTSGIDAKIIGACVNKDSNGKYITDKFYLSPYANDNNFIPWLIEICNKEEINLVLSGVEENIFAISNNIAKLKSATNAIFIVANREQLEIGNDKLKTCQWLKNNNFNYPQYADAQNKKDIEKLLNKTSFPIIAKPRNGKGSKGIFVINSKNELDKLIPELGNYVVQEMLGNDEDEYTVATYTNNCGIFQDAIILKRRLQNGNTIYAETIFNQDIYEECKKITRALGIKGPLNIQLRMHKNKPVCFELNVRFSGTTPIRDLLGFKDLQAAISEYCYKKNDLKEFFNIRKGKVIRIFKEYLVNENL